MTTSTPNSSRLGGVAAAVLFVVVLAAYVSQSQLTQYVQGVLEYRRPYLLLYIAHSSFIVIFPLHLLYLTKVTSQPASAYLSGLRGALTDQFSPLSAQTLDRPFPATRLFWILLILTGGLTCPGLLWYASVSLTSISNVTTLFNTHAFWAYALSVMLANSAWELRKLSAVLIACAGVYIVVSGGEPAPAIPRDVAPPPPPSNQRALVGNGLALISSVTYALCQVLYKKYIAPIPSTTPNTRSNSEYQPILDEEADTHIDSPSPNSVSHLALETSPTTVRPIPPPFGFHPNFFTSCIGFCTLCLLWIPLPILHYTGVEPFMLPPDMETAGSMLAIATSGLIFNGGFMVLLSLWGPVLASVGNLLTIVLVMISDFVFGDGSSTITVYSILGSAMIISAFSVLVFDVLRARRT